MIANRDDYDLCVRMLDVASPDFLSMKWRMEPPDGLFSNSDKWNTEEQAKEVPPRRSPTSPPKTSIFSFAQNNSPSPKGSSTVADTIQLPTMGGSGGIRIPHRSPWSPQRDDDPLHEIRTRIQNGDLFNLKDSALTGQICGMNLITQGVPNNISNNKNINSNNIANGSNNNSSSVNGEGGVNLGVKHESSRSASSSSTGSLDFPAPPAQWTTAIQKNPRPIKQTVRTRPRPVKTYTVTFSGCCSTPKIRATCGACNEEHHPKIIEELRPRAVPVTTQQPGYCRFCESNGDPPEVYQSHSLRSHDGKVTCPVLREYNCPICKNGGGDYAHTIKYCQLARKAKP